MAVGQVLVVIALVWWGIFFTYAAQVAGGNANNIWSMAPGCIIQTSQPCAIIYGIAQMTGYIPYRPEVLWLGGVLLFVGGARYALSYTFSENHSQEHHPQEQPGALRNAFGEPVGYQDETQAASYDVKKWQALLRYDDEVARIAALFEPLGRKWSDKFAADYLAINDKAYLGEIARRLMAEVKAERAAG